MTRTGDARSSNNEEAARSRNEAKPGINMPPQRRASPTPKPKKCPASKGRRYWAGIIDRHVMSFGDAG
jgi:hypothetical protein